MNRKVSVVVTVIGAAALILGLFLMSRMSAALPGVLVGLGAGALGAGMSGVLTDALSRRHPDMAERKTVEQQDERNIAIGNRAKARAYDLVVYVFGALMVAFTLMNAEMTTILLLIGAYMTVVACRVGFAVHYSKTM